MGLPTGTFELGPADGSLVVCTSKAGIGARLAHELVLEAKRWDATVTLLDSVSDARVSATIEPASLEVIEHSGGVRPLSDDDKLEIHQIVIGPEGLQTADHPTITFQSESVWGELPSLSVSGDLTVAGVTQPVSLSVSIDEPEDGTDEGYTFVAHATVVQSDHGISPYSTLFGAIKISDAVEIVIRAPLAAR